MRYVILRVLAAKSQSHNPSLNIENKETVLTHAFDRKMRLKGYKVRYLPEKISEILYIELLKMEAKLKKDKS